jgi:hypothetical protein
MDAQMEGNVEFAPGGEEYARAQGLPQPPPERLPTPETLNALALLPDAIATDLYNHIRFTQDPTQYIAVAKDMARGVVQRNASIGQRRQTEASISPSTENIHTPGSSQNSLPRNSLSAAQIALKKTLLKKIPAIRAYSGAIKNDAAREFLRDCERFFTQTEQLAGAQIDDSDKIINGRGALKDKAERAWSTYEHQLGNSYSFQIHTWQDFKDWILREFSEHLGPEKRWDKFATLQQGQNQSFAEYAMTLQQAATDTEIALSEEVVRQFLRKGARPNLQKKWAEDREHPISLRDTIDRFIQFERGAMIAGYIQKHAQEDDGDPMDLTAMNGSRRGNKGPKCYNCGQFGHIKKRCKSGKKDKKDKDIEKDQPSKNANGQTS